MNTRAMFNMFAAAVVTLVVTAFVAPTDAEAGRTCESMGPNWFPSNQGAQCDSSCSEACIVKWDCDGEACEPHHCWKCAAGSPPPPPPTPPPPDPNRDAGGVRCDAMGPGWYFANQGNACNEACSEACIPKWDCGGQPCRPTHCWKCAAVVATPTPEPGDPGNPGNPGGRVRVPAGIIDTSYQVDDNNLHVKIYVEAIDSQAPVSVDMAYTRADGSVPAQNSGQDTRQVAVSLTVPLDQLPQDVAGVSQGEDGWIEWVIKIGGKVVDFAKKYAKVKPFRSNACYLFDKFEGGACLYKSPTKCGSGNCIKDTVRIEGKADAGACAPKAKAEQYGVKVTVFGISIGTRCLGGAVLDSSATCDACSAIPLPGNPTPGPGNPPGNPPQVPGQPPIPPTNPGVPGL